MRSPQLRLLRAIVKNPFAIDPYLGQRGLITDVHATDERGRNFQIEMQRRNERALRQRMLWGWARGYVLHPDGHINVLILPRCPGVAFAPPLKRDLLPWMRFFNEAEHWNAVPLDIDTPTLEAAMEVLHTFRKDTALSHLYWTQLETERIERDIQLALREQQEALERLQAEREELIGANEQARRKEEETRRSAEAALRASQAQIEALHALLRAAGIKAPSDG